MQLGNYYYVQINLDKHLLHISTGVANTSVHVASLQKLNHKTIKFRYGDVGFAAASIKLVHRVLYYTVYDNRTHWDRRVSAMYR